MIMKRFSEQFNKAADSVTLTKAERSDLKERLVAYMEYHPLPAEMKQAAQPTTLMSEPFVLWRFNTLQVRAVGSMMALFVLLVIPFAAERTVPGDVLYPVKVKFNEEVRSTLALTPYQQVEWETKRLERRLAEARLLASEGKLTEAIEAEVAMAVKTHSEAAQAGLAELRESDSEEAAIAEIALASSLEVESEALANEAARQAAEGEEATVATLVATVADARAAVTTVDLAEVPYEKLLARVEQETTRAYELFDSVRGDISATEQDDINRRLTDVERKIAEAIAIAATPVEIEETTEADVVVEIAEVSDVATTTEAVEETIATSTATSTEVAVVPADVEVAVDAHGLLRQALIDTQKLIRFMSDLDIKNNVTVEEIVPVTLTDEERALTVEQRLVEVERLLTVINLRDTSGEKTQFALTQIVEHTAAARTALTDNDYDAAETAAAEAFALASDTERTTTMNVTETSGPAEEVIEEVATSTEEVVEAVDEPTEEETTKPEAEIIVEEPVTEAEATEETATE